MKNIFTNEACLETKEGKCREAGESVGEVTGGVLVRRRGGGLTSEVGSMLTGMVMTKPAFLGL